MHRKAAYTWALPCHFKLNGIAMVNHWFRAMEHATAPTQVIIFTGVLFIGWNVENYIGLGMEYKKWQHAFINAGFIATNIPLQGLLGLLFAAVIHFTARVHFGLLYLLHLQKRPFFLFLSTFVLLDFGEYLYHLLMHKIKRLWMFHLVHHSDPVVDVSTTLREHPGENLIRNAFTLLWIFLSGAAFWTLLLRQLIQMVSNIFAHVHYSLPEKTANIIGLLFITPNLHHVHHHYRQPYTDCNYGDVLSIWDRLFGTYCNLPVKDIVFGVDTHMDRADHSNIKSLVKIPFGRYRQKPA